MRFTGTFEELKAKLDGLAGTLAKLNPNQVQFRDTAGALMNWYPSTGTINFQGKPEEAKAALERKVAERLAQPGAASQSAAGGDEAAAGEATTEIPETARPELPFELGFDHSELVLGLVGATGTDLGPVLQMLEERLGIFGYESQIIRISSDIIADLIPPDPEADYFHRSMQLMDGGNRLRDNTGDNSVLALAAAAKINEMRLQAGDTDGPEPLPRRAFIVTSLKHPEEVHRLRSIYTNGFFLIGVHADEKRRFDFLTRNKGATGEEAQCLMERDADESEAHGQHTRDTFHLSDFFVSHDGNADKLQHALWRILDLLFGRPYVTPTFDEYAMFMAFSASLRSADLSRQVGAVVARGCNIVATGANDVPRFGGGLYWPELDHESKEIIDRNDGRDYKRGFDSNAKAKRMIVDEIVAQAPDADADRLRRLLRRSRLNDITEYGRVVHAEMEALLTCSRMGISTQSAVLYCTTFPCHNCAKHIIAAGIERVVYVEPYPKSKALEFHSDSISLGAGGDGTVVFAPFVGVGPRSFFNLFSTRLGSGYPIMRKTGDGDTVAWEASEALLRTQMLPSSYIERETLAADILDQLLEQMA